MNQLTHWIDASNVYGSSEEEAEAVRLHENGLLKSSSQKGAKKGELPLCGKNPATSMCQHCPSITPSTCFIAGKNQD